MFEDFKKIITKNAEETRNFGKKLAQNLKGGEVICLNGELGSGKTTFTQGILKELGVKGAVTSPTFIVLKEYKIREVKKIIKNVYHIDTYRIESEDLLNMGWQELIDSKNSVIILEWPERIRDILPSKTIWIDFCLVDDNSRKIEMSQP